MKYILLMTGTKAGVDAYQAWTQNDIQAHFAYLTRLNQDLTASGEFVTTSPLGPPGQAKVVRASASGTPITEGIFPESKEFLLGYWIVDVTSPERAYAIAALLSGGPGPGGARLGMPIEVRQLMTPQTADLP